MYTSKYTNKLSFFRHNLRVFLTILFSFFFLLTDSLNSNSCMNPMRTKRIKCVIQPASSYGDCVEAHPLDGPRTTISEVSPKSSTNSLAVNKDSPNERLSVVAFSDYVIPKMSSKGKTVRNVRD